MVREINGVRGGRTSTLAHLFNTLPFHGYQDVVLHLAAGRLNQSAALDDMCGDRSRFCGLFLRRSKPDQSEYNENGSHE